MAASFYTWKESYALKAHAALEDGLGVVIASDDTHFLGTTGFPAAGAKVDFVTVTRAAAAGQSVDVARVSLGDIVQLRADAAIAYGADVAAKTNGRFITAVATNNVQYRALQAATQGSVFSAVRVDAFVKS